nr:CocE/NonD family hydrolase [Candidatus Palauibacterales bacterium]
MIGHLASLKRPALGLLAGLALILGGSSAALSQEPTGDWYGIMNAGAASLRFTLHVSAADDGYTATMDVPDQSAAGMPIDFVVDEGTVTWRFAPAGVSYEGVVDPGFTRITGTFRQRGQEFPLNFGREELAAPRGSSDWASGRLTKKEVYITMRDGVRLFTSFYVPKDTTEAYPILLMRTPYDSEPGGEDRFNSFVGVFANLVEAGYILAFQDVRGRYM